MLPLAYISPITYAWSALLLLYSPWAIIRGIRLWRPDRWGSFGTLMIGIFGGAGAILILTGHEWTGLTLALVAFAFVGPVNPRWRVKLPSRFQDPRTSLVSNDNQPDDGS